MLPTIVRALAAGLPAALVAATPLHAQGRTAVPVANLRFDSPMGLMAEGALVFGRSGADGVVGPAVVAGVGMHGARGGVGYRMTSMMGMQLMANAFFLRTWNDPLGVPPRQGYVGGDVRVGMMLVSVGLGAIVRVSGDRGARMRPTASIGIGL